MSSLNLLLFSIPILIFQLKMRGVVVPEGCRVWAASRRAERVSIKKMLNLPVRYDTEAFDLLISYLFDPVVRCFLVLLS